MKAENTVELPQLTADQRVYLKRLLSRPVLTVADLETVIGPGPPKPARHKASHVGAPAIFALNEACVVINDAFGDFGCYLVGSALERPDWRDVDVRFIMDDDEFAKLFPDAALHSAAWEHDARWVLLTVSIAERLSKLTGLPIDFQFQPQTFANERHKGPRNALGIRYATTREDT